MLPPHSAHNEPMTGQTVCFTLIYFSFISNHQQKYRKGHVFSNPRTFLIKHLIWFFLNIPYPWNYFSISCIPITFSSNIPYPGNFFREYPVSRKPLMGPQDSLRAISLPVVRGFNKSQLPAVLHRPLCLSPPSVQVVFMRFLEINK